MKSRWLLLGLVVLGAAAGSAVALIRPPAPPSAVTVNPKITLETLKADATSTPPWQRLRDLKWHECSQMIQAYDGKDIMALEAPLLAMLDDATIPVTSRVTATYLLQSIAQQRLLAVSGSPDALDVARDATWKRARGFLYRVLLETDYTTAINHLHTTVATMRASVNEPEALSLLRESGWEILPEDEAALRAQR